MRTRAKVLIWIVVLVPTIYSIFESHVKLRNRE